MKFKNIKTQIAAAFVCLLVGTVNGQIGIGVSGSVNSSAALEVNSTAKGFLPPRMTTVQRDAINSPADGLIIYNSTSGKLNIRENNSWSELSTTNRAQTVSGNNTFSGTSTFNGAATLAGTNTISGPTTISGASTFNNTAIFNNPTTLAGTNSITGNTTISGTSTFNNTATFNNPITFNSVIRTPNYTTTNRNGISSPTTGMLLYNSTTNLLTYRDNSGWKELSSLTGNNSFTGDNSFSGTNTFSGNFTLSGNATLNGNISISGTTTLNSTTTINGEVTMNSRLVVPMAQLTFYNSSGINTNTSATAWNNTTSSTNWTSIVWPSRGSTIGTNTLVDSISTLGARINHNNSGNGAGVIAYKGSSTKMFNITYSINYIGSSTSGSRFDEFVFGLFKNDVLIPGSIFVTDNTTSGERTVTIQAITSLSQNDWVDLRVIGKTGSQSVSVTIYNATMTAFGL